MRRRISTGERGKEGRFGRREFVNSSGRGCQRTLMQEDERDICLSGIAEDIRQRER